MARKKTIALKAAVGEYLSFLESEGKAPPTIGSYRGDYNLLLKHFGEEKEMSKLTAQQLGRLLKSDAVLKSRNGKPKAQASVEKTRRAIRQFFDWAGEKGFIKKSPFPKK